MFKTRTWIIIIAAAAVVLALLSLRLLSSRSDGTVVEVLQDGVVLREIDLSTVAREYSFAVEWTDGGRNIVCVQPGRIRIAEADCPDQICVGQGWLSNQAAPIVCLPHRLVIRLKNVSEIDAVAQ